MRQYSDRILPFLPFLFAFYDKPVDLWSQYSFVLAITYKKDCNFYPVVICFGFCKLMERKMTIMQKRELNWTNEYKMVSYANEKHPLIKQCVLCMEHTKRTGFYIPFWCILAHRNVVESAIVVAQQTANKYSFVNFISLIPHSRRFFFLALAATFSIVVVVCASLLLCNNSSSQKVRKLHVCGLHMRFGYNISYVYNTTTHMPCTSWALYNLIFCVDVSFGCEPCAHTHKFIRTAYMRAKPIQCRRRFFCCC